MSEIDAQKQNLCRSCGSKIPADANVCAECHAYQDWRRYLSTTSVVAASLISVIALAGPLKTSFDYIWNLCCASMTLDTKPIQPLTLTNYEIERRLQVSKLSSAISVTNPSAKGAVITAVLVEHTGGTQVYFAEGCGYKELPNIVVGAGGGTAIVPFEMDYWVLIAEQLSQQLTGFEIIFSKEKFGSYMRGAGEGMKENVAGSANVMLLWTDGNGVQRRVIVKGRPAAFSERAIKYPGTEAEFQQGGFSNPYCFSNEARRRAGIEDSSASKK